MPYVSVGRISIARGLLLLLAATMIAVSFYLTYHYFYLHFPKSMDASSFCDFSAYWNCDVATLSPLASLAGIPSSAFGIVVGWLLLLAGCFATPKREAAAYLLALLNALGCVGLLIYSLGVLGGLCPGCVLYYCCSLLILMLFVLNSSARPGLGGWLEVAVACVSGLVIVGLVAYQAGEERSKVDEVAQKLISEVEASPNFEALPAFSPFQLARATEKFADAPLRVTIFSDFQCPICRVFAEMLPKIISHFQGRLNMQYIFYPLDNSCNGQIRETFHPLACEASYVAACAGDNFRTIHDELYANQDKFSPQWFQQLANRYDLSVCYHGDKPAQLVSEMLAAGDAVGVKATPTILVNGKKLEGLLPLKMLLMIMEKELERSK